MQKLRILYVASEIKPFLKISKVANLMHQLPQDMQEKGMEIRILVPRFGVINERKNRLHEVVRLSGINITVGDEERPLMIKVASIPSAKIQVYFIDNDDLFCRKAVFGDEQEPFFADNDERAIFFCKGVLETVKKLGWAPDIVHCHDWMTALIPMYLKTAYQKEPIFQNTKSVFTVYDHFFDYQFSEDFADKVRMLDLAPEEIPSLQSRDFEALLKTGLGYADAITKDEEAFSSPVQALLTQQNSEKEIHVIEDTSEFSELYYQLYNELVSVE
ncbi:MAG: glycogen/starch synthase [Microscillaceae bacterium]